MKQKSLNAGLMVVIILLQAAGIGLVPATKVEAARAITFPVIGSATYGNDYNAPRGNVTHHAIDIIAKKGQLLVAAVNGTIVDVQYPQPSWGYSVTIRDDDGYRYTYIHMNDDTPGTNDGRGGAMNAYAADVREGNRVVAGQLLGKVGDSGRSNGVSHLHFEMYLPNGNVVNPYNSLRSARKISSPKNYPRLAHEMLPYGLTFKGGANMDYGNVDADVEEELITGARKGGRSYVHVFENGAVVPGKVFEAFRSTFLGGVDVAAGDVDGDGVDEIITGAGPSGNPSVRVFEKDGTMISAFEAHGTKFRGGVNVTAGDVDGDGVDEIITGAGVGGAPEVTIRKLNQPILNVFHAYNTDFRGGTDVAAGDIEGDNTDEIIIGLGPGGAPRIRALTLNGTQKLSLLAYEGGFRGGVRVSSGNVRTGTVADEIVTSPATEGSPYMKMFGGTGTNLDAMYFFEEWWTGANYDVAAGENIARASAGGNRRTTIRLGVD